MEDSLDKASFAFVNYRGPRLSTDPNVRKVIKRQAMKDIAAARKQSGRYGKCNLGQYPQPLRRDDMPNNENLPTQKTLPSSNPLQHQRHHAAPLEGENSGKRDRRDHDTPISSQHEALCGIPCSGLAISESEFRLLKLVPLTGLRLGIITSSHLRSWSSKNKDHFSIPHVGTRKLLSFIPSRYHEVPLLRHATNCVIVKLRQMLLGPDGRADHGEAIVLSHYTRAVRALRAALEDDNQRLAPETLCAVDLLIAFETLNNYGDSHSWLHHVTGAARLIEARGSERFNTDFDMALFMTSVGPTVMEAFLSNKACFLEEDHWEPVLRRAVFSDSSFANQNHLAFALWHHLFAGPKLFKDTTDIVFEPETPKYVVEELIQRLLGALSGLTQWLHLARQLRRGTINDELEASGDDLDFHCQMLNDDFDSDSVTQMTLRGTFTMCYILKARLLYSMAPSRFHDLELECQKLAEEVVESNQDLNEDEIGRLKWTSFVSQSVWLAKGIRETKQSWGEGWQERKGVIERWKFEAWCKAIGRQCPSA